MVMCWSDSSNFSIARLCFWIRSSIWSGSQSKSTVAPEGKIRFKDLVRGGRRTMKTETETAYYALKCYSYPNQNVILRPSA